MNPKTLQRETLRALKFLFLQYRKGWTIQEALLQVRGSYGSFVFWNVEYIIHNHKYN